jgi:hypothetical protein
MNRYSPQSRLGIRFRISLAGVLSFLGLGILLIASYPNLIIAEKIASSPQPETEVTITRDVFQITNRCPQPHYFRVASDIKDPGFKQQTDAIFVPAKATKQIEVLTDAMESTGKHKAAVECLDCKKEDGCAQDRYEVPIDITPATIALKGKTPASPGSPRSASVLSRQNQPTDVGVIPDTYGQCPIGSEYISIGFDDEDNNNASSVTGWTGAIVKSAIGTTFGFCRVDGNQFHSLPTRDYAVLQLGATCPAGSVSIFRVFDNEHNNNVNWSSGNISPNIMGPPAQIYFCFFRSGVTPTMTSFPSLYVPYGVFAAPPSLMGLSTGVVHTDDEDINNNDYTYTTAAGVNLFANIIYGTENGTIYGPKNTNLLTTKVRNATPCTNPCPYHFKSMGAYDGANCHVGTPPAGTTAFIWGNAFYYTPVNGNQCPMGGSSFDGANCLAGGFPPQSTPFIWSNMWYIAPVCRP